MTTPQEVTLDTIGNGALLELFQAELARVLANITDPNTDDVAKRVISIQVKFKPNRERDVAEIDLSCNSKLAGIRSVSSQVFLGRQGGRLVAVESNPKQPGFFDEPKRPLAAVAAFQTKE